VTSGLYMIRCVAWFGWIMRMARLIRSKWPKRIGALFITRNLCR